MALVALSLAACARPAPAAQGPVRARLPEVQGFSASPLESGPKYVRRSYARGAAKLSVTLAELPQDADGYASWRKMSAAYPSARLPVDGSGFYDCKGEGAQERCDLHAQLRSGFHLEIFGSGTATRGDLDDLVAALPLPGAPVR